MISSMINSQMFNEPSPANVPAAKRSESPGKNGMITNPVSTRMTRNRMTYV